MKVVAAASVTCAAPLQPNEVGNGKMVYVCPVVPYHHTNDSIVQRCADLIDCEIDEGWPTYVKLSMEWWYNRIICGSVAFCSPLT